MKTKRMLLAVAVAVSSTVFVAAAPGVSAAPEPYPFMEAWPTCGSSAEEYCVESLDFTPPGGETQSIDDPGNTMQSSHPYVRFFDQRGMGVGFPMLGFVIQNPTSGSIGVGTNDGLDDGTYRFVVRIADFDPTVFISSGLVDDYEITRGDDGYWTADITISPKVWAGAGPSLVNVCNGRFGNWPTECETAGMATKRYISGAFVTIDQGLDTTEARGMWIATNAVGFQFPQFNVADRSVSAVAVGPHYLPTDYAEDCVAEGLETDDTGKCLTPAHYVTYMPFKTIAALLNMPIDIVKAYITGDAMTAEVEGEVVRNFDVDAEQFGIRVDLNLEHYSKPNPKIKFKAIKTLKAGTASSRTNFITVPQGFTLSSFSFGKMSSRGLCTQQFSAIKAAANKTGFCVVNWSYMKPGSRTISKKSAIRIIR